MHASGHPSRGWVSERERWVCENRSHLSASSTTSPRPIAPSDEQVNQYTSHEYQVESAQTKAKKTQPFATAQLIDDEPDRSRLHLACHPGMGQVCSGSMGTVTGTAGIRWEVLKALDSRNGAEYSGLRRLTAYIFVYYVEYYPIEM